MEKNTLVKPTLPRLFYLNSANNSTKEKAPVTQDSRMMRTESLRSKHVGRERERDQDHAQNLPMKNR